MKASVFEVVLDLVKNVGTKSKLISAGLATLVLTLASPSFAQDVPTKQEFWIWNAVLSTARLTSAPSGPSLWLDVHARRGEAGSVGIVRPGVGMGVAPWLSVWAGYAWVPVFADADGSQFNEHRIWQQAILTHRLESPAVLQARTRLEQRFGGADLEVGHRVRQFVRAGWSPKALPFGLVVWDEVFVGLNDVGWGPQAGYDQNRMFGGAALPIGDWARFEAGYLLVHLNRQEDRIIHALAFNLFLSIK